MWSGTRKITANDYHLIEYHLDCFVKQLAELEPETSIVIVSGGAKGVDAAAETFADRNNLRKHIYYPHHERYGFPKAFFVRNEKIVAASDKVIAFWDGKSTGTKHTIELAKKANKLWDIVKLESR